MGDVGNLDVPDVDAGAKDLPSDREGRRGFFELIEFGIADCCVAVKVNFGSASGGARFFDAALDVLHCAFAILEIPVVGGFGVDKQEPG